MKRVKDSVEGPLFRIDISDDDIFEAMRDIPGYLDVTPGDLEEIFFHAYRRAFERIACSSCAVDLMTRNVYTVRRETPLPDVAELMAVHEISGVPVVDTDRRVVGMISEKDFCFHMGGRRSTSLMGVIADCASGRDCLALSIRERRAGEIMTSPVITVHEDTVLLEISAILSENQINRVPVVDGEERLVGIVSRADVVTASSRATD